MNRHSKKSTAAVVSKPNVRKKQNQYDLSTTKRRKVCKDPDTPTKMNANDETGVKPLDCKFKPILLQDDESIRFKPNVESLEEPTFLNIAYCVQPTTTDNTLTVDILDLNPLINRPDVKKSTITFDFYICLVHGLSEERFMDCEYCCQFNKFNYTYILKTKYYYLTFPPPICYTPKVFNFLKPFCETAYKNATSAKSVVKADKELESYSKFISMDFSDGSLYSLSTGKTSYIRNYVLGFPTSGIRATLTMDVTLSPQYAILPQWIYDKLHMACPIAIINRAPSINTTCIYAVELLRNPDPMNFTLVINSYVAERMHADQDGDELTIFYLKHPGTNEPTHEIAMAITELKKFSWKYGMRHDITNKPRYEFTQYLKYILHRYDKYFCKHNKLWASLQGNAKKKCDTIMHLGSSIAPREVDEFIDLLSNFVKHLDVQLPSITDLLNGTDSVLDVIKSGAKGELLHMETYLQQLFSWNYNRTEQLKKNFDNYIRSGAEMSTNGAYQFLFLGAINGIYLLHDNLYYNDKVIMRNVSKFTALASIIYNAKACIHTFNCLANSTANKLISDKEVENYLSNIA